MNLARHRYHQLFGSNSDIENMNWNVIHIHYNRIITCLEDLPIRLYAKPTIAISDPRFFQVFPESRSLSFTDYRIIEFERNTARF